MSIYQFHMLAQGDELNLIITIAVAAIVGIGSLISAAKKKQKELEARLQHQQDWARIEQEMRERAAKATQVLTQQPGAYPQAAPPPVPQSAPVYPPPPPVFAPTRSIEGPYVPPRPPPQPRRQVAARKPPVPVRPVQHPPMNRPQARRQKQKQASRLPPAPPLEREASDLPPLPSAPRPIEASPTSRENAPAATANAAALSRWLTPETLRSQFILTEILQPPLALRDPGSGRPAP